MEINNLYPPSVVMLSPGRRGIEAPEADSPLSSAPNSPNTMRDEIGNSGRDLAMPVLQQRNEPAPFDEGIRENTTNDDCALQNNLKYSKETA